MQNKKLFRTVSIGQRQQISNKFQEIDEEKFYIIECRLNCFCLRSEPKTCKMHLGDAFRITGNIMEKNYMKQLWMFKRVSSTQYQIIHVKTDLVLTIQDFEGRLEVGKQDANQKFQVIPWKNGYVRIKDYTGAILRIDGILQTGQFSQRDEAQLFRLNSRGMFDIPWLKDTIFILTDNKGSSLDLVNAARQNQCEIIIFRKNFRMNQRWRIIAISEGKGNSLNVHILSALTQMFVVHNRESGGLMQASYPEEWLIQQTQIKEYIYIRHAKLGEYLSYNQIGQICFTQTKRSKWYIQNGTEGLYLKKSSLGLGRTITI